MIAGRRAKVSNFGMSKLAGAAPSMTPLTMCPGTLAYMPPEALREPPRYTKKLDCFSEVVIMIQVCTRLWPEPGPQNKLVPDSRSPTGMMDMPVLETKRRKNHIDMINPAHPLLPIAMDCFHYQESERPSSEELCQRLAGLKESLGSIKRMCSGNRMRFWQKIIKFCLLLNNFKIVSTTSKADMLTSRKYGITREATLPIAGRTRASDCRDPAD